MSTIAATNLKNASSGSNNIVLNADGTIGGAAMAGVSDVNGVNTTGTVTSGTTSLVVASAAGITAGMFVVGEGITPGTTVSSIASTTVTLSANAGATLSSAPVTFYSANKVLSPATVGGMLCRAWVNFFGAGTVSINASYNVSSITDNGVGNYTVNFTTAMPDANYSIAVATGNSASNINANIGHTQGNSARSASSVDIATRSIGGNSQSLIDSGDVNVAIFR